MSRALFLLVMLCGLVGAADWAPAQTPAEPREKRLLIPNELQRRAQPGNLADAHQLMNLRRRLVELDRLLSLGSLAAAETLLMDLEQHSALQRELVTRRIKLAQLQGQHQKAVDLGLHLRPWRG